MSGRHGQNLSRDTHLCAQVPTAMSAVILTGYIDTCLDEEIIQRFSF